MGLAANTKLGPYEILSPLGAGGMGEVYRAHDSKLNRDVALKVLPEVLAQDPERMARFKREAQVLASLNHPNIATIYGFEEADGIRALAMELVEGQTLAEIIAARHGVAVSDALPIAKQTADALEYAHERGIIHRDLKPANVKVTPAGTVKVLDFGLAKALHPNVEAGLDPAQGGPPQGSPLDVTTLTDLVTQQGVPIGTAAYMSPEQARGKAADRRADIWSFGAVLYEMLTGKRPFEAHSLSDTLAAVLTKEPDWNALPRGAPWRIRELVRRCLIKDPKQRLRDIGEARIVLEGAISGAGADDESFARAGGETPPLQRVLPWVVAGVLAVALIIMVVWPKTRGPAARPGEIRFTVPLPAGMYPNGVAVSQDGKSIAFVANSLGNRAPSLWVRSLGTETLRHLADGADFPFWSPDSRTIGFFADGKLKTVSAGGGPVQTICDAEFAWGGTWSPKGVILFGQSPGPVMRVQATGGTPAPATKAETGYSHVMPDFLSDGTHFIYDKSSYADAIYAGSLDSKETKLLLNIGPARFAPPDHLLFFRDGVLMTQKLDIGQLELTGEASPLTGVVTGLNSSVSANDAVLAYLSPATGFSQWFAAAQLAWYDRAGKELGKVGPVGNYLQAKLSPDGKLVVVDAALDMSLPLLYQHLFLLNLSNGVYSRMTLGAIWASDPAWSPDSRSIVYVCGGELMELGVGQSEPTEVLPNGFLPFLDDWSKDGKYIIARSSDQRSAYALPMTGERKPILMVQDSFIRDQFHFSPDSRWVAYNSNESGRMEVYIASFPKMDHKHQVSTGGGSEPVWRGDGKELYYLTPDGKLMAVDVTAGEDIGTGTPGMLFQTGLQVNIGVDQYAATSDGKKFLLLDPVSTAAANATQSQPIHVILNWDAAIGELDGKASNSR